MGLEWEILVCAKKKLFWLCRKILQKNHCALKKKRKEAPTSLPLPTGFLGTTSVFPSLDTHSRGRCVGPPYRGKKHVFDGREIKKIGPKQKLAALFGGR